MADDVNTIVERRLARVMDVLCRTMEMEAMLRAAAKGEQVPQIERKLCGCGEFHGDFTFKDATPLDDQAIAVVALVQQLVAIEEQHPAEFKEMMSTIITIVTEFVHVIPAAYNARLVAVRVPATTTTTNPGGMFS